MKIIPEVTCRRCGSSYPATRSHCPNCGTRTVNQSRRSPAGTPSTVEGTAAYDRNAANTRWQMIFGGILVVAVILAVIVMVSTSLSGADKKSTSKAPAPVAEVTDELPTVPQVEAPPTPTPTPPPAVEKIQIRYIEEQKTEFTMQISEILTVNALVTPATITDKVTWSCTDEDGEYLKLTVDPEDGNKVQLECLASKAGGVTLIASLAGVEAKCQVYLAS